MSVDTPTWSRVGYCRCVGNCQHVMRSAEPGMEAIEIRLKLLTVEQTAERLGVKPATIRSWILKREKIEVVKVGRLVRIKESSIHNFIDKNTIPPKEGRK
jgi:excisionase family DNA binding protein